jgi:hypothetical protein
MHARGEVVQRQFVDDVQRGWSRHDGHRVRAERRRVFDFDLPQQRLCARRQVGWYRVLNRQMQRDGPVRRLHQRI